MKVIFLDIDGVLNSIAWQKSRPPKEQKIITDALAHWKRSIDRDCVARLNRICRETGASVVISSSWRTMLTAGELMATLIELGFDGDIIGQTLALSGSRWQEIEAWLNQASGRIDSYVILDDDEVLPATRAGCFVRTDYCVGLTDDDASRAIVILGKTP